MPFTDVDLICYCHGINFYELSYWFRISDCRFRIILINPQSAVFLSRGIFLFSRSLPPPVSRFESFCLRVWSTLYRGLTSLSRSLTESISEFDTVCLRVWPHFPCKNSTQLLIKTTCHRYTNRYLRVFFPLWWEFPCMKSEFSWLSREITHLSEELTCMNELLLIL